MKSKYRVDWRDLLKKVLDCVTRSGGVVAITAGPDAAGSDFTEIVREDLKRREWLTVRLAPDDEGTRYRSDIVNKLLVTLEGASSFTSMAQKTPSVVIGGKIEAEYVYIYDNDVVVNGEAVTSLYRDIDGIKAYLTETLKKRRVLLMWIVTDDTPEMEANWFTKELWDEHLSELCDHGLSLIVVCPPSSSLCLPEADELITLPDAYEDNSRVEALQDLTTHIRRTCPSWGVQEATAAAKALLAAANARPRLLLTGLATRLLRLLE